MRLGGIVALTTLLFAIQPVARLWGRITHQLTPWRTAAGVRQSLSRRRAQQIWSERWPAAEEWSAGLEDALPDDCCYRRGEDYDSWDLEIRGGLTGSVQVLLAVEEHGAGKQLAQWEARPVWSRSTALLTFCFAVLGGTAATAGHPAIAVILGSIAGALGAWMF
jgi:hypothetical protein